MSNAKQIFFAGLLLFLPTAADAEDNGPPYAIPLFYSFSDQTRPSTAIIGRFSTPMPVW
jgi:hypothetical protein